MLEFSTIASVQSEEKKGGTACGLYIQKQKEDDSKFLLKKKSILGKVIFKDKIFSVVQFVLMEELI